MTMQKFLRSSIFVSTPPRQSRPSFLNDTNSLNDYHLNEAALDFACSVFNVTNMFAFPIESTGDELFFLSHTTLMSLLYDNLHGQPPSKLSMNYFGKALMEVRARFRQCDPQNDDMLLLGVGFLAIQQVR